MWTVGPKLNNNNLNFQTQFQSDVSSNKKSKTKDLPGSFTEETYFVILIKCSLTSSKDPLGH